MPTLTNYSYCPKEYTQDFQYCGICRHYTLFRWHADSLIEAWVCETCNRPKAYFELVQ